MNQIFFKMNEKKTMEEQYKQEAGSPKAEEQ
jgi:hypothetical protein